MTDVATLVDFNSSEKRTRTEKQIVRKFSLVCGNVLEVTTQEIIQEIISFLF